ncbi:YdbL family protein [Sphingomonas sp. HMP6]|uniref:YdbL family protein n=1 Tax=Sphingomonas sp. HMP6 TaxID=1517551 RepID=UPI001596BDF1|nr:YdbL family protein [Sphingomonas sp. HMP6]BCA60000.1 hypothetical protein HMP06_2769 [Sphingomonas sp. HMP6]
MTRMFKILIAALALLGASTAALAQRDPAYQAARTAGQIGEQPDGYLGVVGTGTAELRAMINNINIQRKAAYTQQSAQSGSTVDQFAVTSGCNLIARTVPGEKYKAPDGTWKTRTSAPPERIASCI